MRLDIHKEAASLGATVSFQAMPWHTSGVWDATVGVARAVIGTERTFDTRFSHLNPLTKSQTDLIALHELGHINDGVNFDRYRYNARYTLEVEAKAWVYAIDVKGRKNLTDRDWSLIEAALGSYVCDHPTTEPTPTCEMVMEMAYRKGK